MHLEAADRVHIRGRMTTLSFENLDFSFLIETEQSIAYLQEWEEGNWGEAEKLSLPQSLDRLPKHSRLARALKSFRGDAQLEALREALEPGVVRKREPERNLWTFLQTSSRGLATRIAEFIYA
jgi:hypothetical protein